MRIDIAVDDAPIQDDHRSRFPSVEIKKDTAHTQAEHAAI
jgi:hypothetical protein